jgi:hypothetical protein
MMRLAEALISDYPPMATSARYPGSGKMATRHFFGQSFQIADEVGPRTFTRPAGGTCLADLAAKYIK